jgi:ribosomal protein S12 methylthiotransferase
MLRRMRRGHGGKRLYELVDRMKLKIRDLVLRTAFIVGHPGETREEFDELVAFVRYAEFDRMGVFQYSDEPSARAFTFEDKVPERTAHTRAKRLMDIQRPISRRKNEALIGRELVVLVEGPSEDSPLVMAGRHAGQAPEIDGTVYLSGGEARPGELCRARISQASDYDLVGEVAEVEDAPDLPPRVAPRASPVVHKSSDGRRVTLRTVP